MKEEEKYIMTDEQWNAFKEASPHFLSSKHDYIRNCPKWLSEQTINIYESVTGKTILNKNLNCAVCILNMFKITGKLYFDELERRNKKQNEIENEKGNNNKENGTPDNGNQKKKKGSSSKVQGRLVKKKNS